MRLRLFVNSCCLALLILGVTILPGYAQDEPTATPTIEPKPIETKPVILLITPTPDHKPPSLIIDLSNKIITKTVPPEVDQAVDKFWWWVLDRQLEYHNLSGKFAQMLWSHKALPGDGQGALPDGWYGHPTDQDWSWDDLNAIQYEPVPFAIKIDVYDGPNGVGYVACFRLMLGGTPFERCKNYGGESSNGHEWRPVKVIQ